MDQLLTTKLFIPPARSALVARTRLHRLLDLSLDGKLTLISAPAGFGKTTLVADWLRIAGEVEAQSVAWLSLDQGDNEIAGFLAYFAAALNQIEVIGGAAGKKAISMLRSSQPPPAQAVLTLLINEIASNSENIIFVLDDYHLIDDRHVHEALAFFLDNQPPQIHLVIATREDPPLPLSRLRARGQLAELRAADLRFTIGEAAGFLNQVMGLDLTEAEIAALERRTEGWIAGLHLAALSLQGQPDKSRLIHSFTGSNRLVLDYLVEEVLDRQPPEVQSFLLRTAVLERLCGPLCDALTGQGNGQETLEMLDRANLFTIPLDSERRWFRYHHLFADLLGRRLRQADPERISALHRRASAWYRENCLWPEAVRHAFDAGDHGLVAELAELAWQPMNMRYLAVTWLGWVNALPDDLVRARPWLSAGCGWASLDAGDLKAADFHLRNAETWLESKHAGDLERVLRSGLTGSNQAGPATLPDEDAVRSLTISVLNGRAYFSQGIGDLPGTLEYAQRAIDLLREEDHFERGLSKILRGFAFWAGGNLESAREAVADAVSDMQAAGKPLFIISFTSYLADILVSQGRLEEAAATCTRLLGALAQRGERLTPEASVLYLCLSELHLERGDLEAARQHLRRAEGLGEQPAFAPWYRRWVSAHARVMEAQGDLEGVIDLLREAEDLYYRHPIPDVRPLKALLARAWLAQGRLDAALRCIREVGLSTDDDPSILREFGHSTLARVLIAQYRRDRNEGPIRKAASLLERLLRAAEAGRRTGSMIEILVLQALAYEARGSIPPALEPLKRALALAEPEGYVRAFVGEGPEMARLLYEALSQDIFPVYTRRLLAAFPQEKPEPAAPNQQPSGGFDWIEPLSERELEVLQLIDSGLTNPEIASELYLALNTVKAHTRNIYSKLGVNNRTQAGARARAMGLLPHS